ncbi:MAG TPA: outer membrane lipoprotein-sorting protein [Nitrospiria bacterium]|nr:outer membrane lipoprotein-sorting protein [Nitrospiria bacterium]
MLLSIVPANGAQPAESADATALVRAAFDNWRAKSSETTLTMIIHRPSWERRMEMKAWTRGDDEALVRFTAPARDAGNATLKLGNNTWIYNPKLNQVIKLPPSLLAQSWMGSDFSYNDLSKAEDILTEYTHRITGSDQAGGHAVYTIEAIPKPGAPVVWGKQEVKVRDDGIFLEETYFDQDMKPVRAMTTDKIGPLGGRDYPLILTMHPVGKPGQWTRVETTEGKFNMPLADYIFTRSNLENPRE